MAQYNNSPLDPEQQDYLAKLLAMAPPIPNSDQSARAQELTKQQMKNVAYDPSMADDSFPPSMYNKNLDQAKADIEEEKHAGSIGRGLSNNESDRLKELIDKANTDKEPASDTEDKKSAGMAESLASRSGDATPAIKEDQSKDESSDSDNKEPKDLSLKNLPRMQAPITEQAPDYMKALMDAQRQSQTAAALQMMGKGAERFGAGIARVPHDKDYLNEMSSMINQPVQNVLEQQHIGALGLDEQLKRRQVALQQDMDNPNSQASQIARQILKEGAPNLNTDGLTATEMNQLIPGLKTVLESKLNREAKTEAMRERMQLAFQKDSDKKEQHQKDKWTSSALTTRGLLEAARGQPAVAQAEKDIYAAAKADELMNQYGDPNKMPNAQVKMLVMEVGKIAQGGIPTKTELDALSPGTLQGQLSGVWGKLMNHPTAANAGAFLKQYQDYAHGITKQAQKVLEDKYTRVIESSKPHLSPEDYQLFNDQYVNRFKNANKPAAPQGMVKIKRKSDGAIKTLSADQATPFLEDPNFEVVK